MRQSLLTLVLAVAVLGLRPALAATHNPQPSATAKNATVKPYPVETCLVSGEKLGGMGKPYVFVHKGQEVKLCCKSCLKDFQKDPAKYTKALPANASVKPPADR
jgi:hypothetical protein